VSVPLYQAKAEFFKTLGHPARIRILELLSERDHSVRDLLEAIDVEPSNLSQQLSILRRTSLVASHRHEGEVHYSLSAPGVRELLLAARGVLHELTRIDDDVNPLWRAPRTTTATARKTTARG
jgi:DNA-binding transcriptional ArsR family regulator